MSHAAPHVAISYIVIPHVVCFMCPHMPWLTSGCYAYLTISYIQARLTKLESVFSLQNPVHNCACVYSYLYIRVIYVLI